MRVLVLRPEPDATRSAAALGKLGHEVVVAPLFTVRPTDASCPGGPFDAAVITSANAVAPLLARTLSGWTQVPLFAVGERSAAVARQAGFTQVRSADGGRSDLIALAKTQLQPGARVLLALGRDHKDDLAPRLAEAGLRPVLWAAYQADAADTLPDTARVALEAGDLDAVLHYSRRGAEVFIALARDAKCWEKAACLTHLALSEDVTAPLRASGASHVVIATHPDEPALLQILSGINARNRQASGDNLVPQPDQRPAPGTGPLTGDSMSADENDRRSDPAGQPSARAGRVRRQAIVIEGGVIAAPAAGAAVSEADQAISAETPGTGMPPAPAMPENADAPATPATPAEAPAFPALRQFGARAVVGAGLLGGVLGTGLALVLPRLIPSFDVSISRTTSLDQRLARLQETAVPRQALDALDLKIGAATATAVRTQTESAATAKRLSDLLAAAPSGADTATIAPIAERAKRAEAIAVSATESLAAREKLLDEAARKISELTVRLAAVEQTAKTDVVPGAAANNATRLVLTSRIAQALESGRPFASDLKALGSAGSDRPDATRLAPLLAVADRGAASREALLSEFRHLRPALEQDTVTQSASLGDRVLKMMGSVVSIRPLGEQSGTSPFALTSRIDQGLLSGDMTAAATAWKLLPEPARRASESFGMRLAARASAVVAIRQIEDETVAALGVSR